MMRITICLLWIVLLFFHHNLAAQPENLYMVTKHDKDGSKTGYVNKDGKLVVDYIYHSGGFFKNGFAVVNKERRRGAINAKGELVLPIIYSEIGILPGGLLSATVYPDSLYLFDTTGKEIFAGLGRHAYAYPEINRVFIVAERSTTGLATASLLDLKGRVIKQFSSTAGGAGFDILDQTRYAPPYRSKLLQFWRNGTTAITDLDGNILIDSIRFQVMARGDIRIFGNNKAALADSSLHMLIPFSAGYTELSFIGNTPLYSARKGDKYGVVDRNGKVIIGFKLKYRVSSNNDHILEVRDEQTGKLYEYYDYKGKLIVQSNSKIQLQKKWPAILPSGDSMYRLWKGKFLGKPHKAIDQFNEEGFTVFEDADMMGVMDSNGKILFKADYPFLAPPYNGIAAAGIFIPCPACKNYPCSERMVFNGSMSTRQFFYLDPKGKKLFDTTYNMIQPFREGQAIVTQNCNSKYFIDAKGKPVGNKDLYEYLSVYAHGVRIVKKTGFNENDETIYSQEGAMQADSGSEVALMDRSGKIISPVVNFISTTEASYRPHINFRPKGGNMDIPFSHAGKVQPEFKNGLVKFKKGDYWGLMDTTGQVVTTGSYLSIEQLGDHYKVSTRDDKWTTYGALDSTGKIIIPAEYYDLHFYSDRGQRYFVATKEINGPVRIIPLSDQ
jgi:hypothetical protein